MKQLSTDSAIITENLSKSWCEVHALKDLNLKVSKNSIFGFLGPNGAGKTTTIKLLLGVSFVFMAGQDLFIFLIPALQSYMIQIMPKTLIDLATLAAYGQPLPVVTPILFNALWCIVFVTGALWRFRKEEI